MANIQIEIITGQSITNVLPALHIQATDEVWLLVTQDKFQQKAADVSVVLDKYHIKTTIKTIDASSATSLEQSFADIRKELDACNANFIFNTTGGTKLMSIIGMKYFQHAMYMDIDYSQIFFIKDNSIYNSMSINYEMITIKDYLRLYSYHIETTNTNNTRFDKYQSILTKFAKLEADAIQLLNRVTSSVKKDSDYKVDYNQIPNFKSKYFHQKFEFLNQSTIAEVTPSYIKFANVDALGFCKGNWLEILLYQKIKSLGVADRHIMWGTKIYKKESQTARVSKNTITEREIDVVFSYRNNVYLCECKTTFYSNGNIASDAFKLEALSLDKGLMAKKVFVTAINNPTLKTNQNVKNHIDKFINGLQELNSIKNLSYFTKR